jgi:hypothetical protein
MREKLENLLLLLLFVSVFISIILLFLVLSSAIWTDDTKIQLYCLQLFLKSMFFSTIPLYVIVRILE